MTDVTRRQMVAGSAGMVGMATLAAPAQAATDRIADDLDRYTGFGIKASGSAGDLAAGAWLDGELKAAGYVTRRLPFEAPFFEIARAELTAGSARAAVVPQAIVVPTGPAGITGPLRRVTSGGADAPLAGAMALLELPHNRWTTAAAGPVRKLVTAALAAGALAVVVITTGPTGLATALNADGRKPMFDKPVAILSPRDAQPFLVAAAAGTPATLVVTGRGGRRPTYNVVGTMDRGQPRWIVVSTPRSGWFTCAAERGGGVAAWAALARWAPAALPGFNLAFLCNSGHEYEYLGAEHAFDGSLPAPPATALWVHLGANVAARDWQELTGELLPLPSADPERYLVTSPALLDHARRLFAGQPGLEAPRGTDGFVGGELTNVIKAGYPTVFGIFGAHRFHHTADDDRRCHDAAATARVVESLKALLSTR